jgi:hypothetical protein
MLGRSSLIRLSTVMLTCFIHKWDGFGQLPNTGNTGDP